MADPLLPLMMALPPSFYRRFEPPAPTPGAAMLQQHGSSRLASSLEGSGVDVDSPAWKRLKAEQMAQSQGCSRATGFVGGASKATAFSANGTTSVFGGGA
eukprot:TRINITY_DN46709_c0_g1_i2.p1 TRINITY_DN46709_c0_g1~~TRINITY_DN46709_c0_g1_i2.p1  ORF type:complete len:100 (-),score=26.65 TRINITY_DN46709_c0_g1_i2:215-514(-)